MGCGTSFVKYVLFFFNLLVALLGLAVIGIGVAFHLNWTAVKEELNTRLTVAPWLFIIVGSIMFIIAFFGCCGAIRESHCMVVTYAIFLLVIIIVQVVIAVLMFVYGDTIQTNLDNSIASLFTKRTSAGVDKATDAVINSIQQQFECCGKDSATTEYGLIGLPASCCPPNSLACTPANAFDGCRPVITKLYNKWNKPIAGVAIGVACIEVVGALFALCLANSIRNMDRRSRY
ncbi:hypothetical protein PYW08_003604 [Mythimna loreyi]|uniref:Uncharacterized protein n=1 Tax=Mythimna loreyi TaxID=667449 RepID=A0ACC2QXB9_9NEOP|nr:hypothetical protein PYW08_003604 [Mythimna loreyi]